MLSLAYVSSSTRDLDSNELVEILEKSRANNTLVGVTGMLLYKDGNFIQVLEGADPAVLAIYQKIARDPRHKGVIMLLKEQRSERQFPEWSMGFCNLRDVDLQALPGYRDFRHDSLTSPAFVADPTRAQSLLFMFRKKM